MNKKQSANPMIITLEPDEIEQIERFVGLFQVAKNDDVPKFELQCGENAPGKFHYENGKGRYFRVDSAEDLTPEFCLNPPPENGRCDCCRRHISELKPFGKAGDPLVGDFEGALLLKTYRREGPYDEKAVSAMDEAIKFYEADSYADPEEWLTNKYGKDEGSRLYLSAVACTSTFASWECRDCIVLNENDYFERLRKN